MNLSLFGYANQTPVYKHTIKSENIQVDVIDLGCIITDVRVRNKSGNFTSVVLGYDTLEKYLNDQDYYGAIVGRFANRIENGRFTLNGKTYQVTQNEGNHALHGGVNGFNKRVWTVDNQTENSITFAYLSADGEEGFPANLSVKVTYKVTDCKLCIEYFAESDADTVISLTNHSYFNVDGVENTIDNLKLFIDANYVTATDQQLIPHGEILKVSNTCFDFNNARHLLKGKPDGKTLPERGCFDDNFVLNGSGFRKVATLFGSKGLNMDVYTDQPGMQVYSGNVNAVALETQNFPNAVNCNNFPSAILKKGEKYNTKTEYKFYLDK